MTAAANKKTIAESISDFNEKFPGFTKDSTNPHFHSNYASLDGIMHAIREPLRDVGLFIEQTTKVADNGDMILVTTLSNSDGSLSTSELALIMEKKTAHALGSSLTYGRRYAICLALNLVEQDSDDDGNSATKKEKFTPPKDEVTAAQVNTIIDLRNAYGSEEKIDAWIKTDFLVDDPRKLTGTQALRVIQVLGDRLRARS